MHSLGYHYLIPEKNKIFRMSVTEKIMIIASLFTLSIVLLIDWVVVNGLAKAFAKTDEEKTPIAESWFKMKGQITLFPGARLEGQQVNTETTKGVVMLRGKVNSDAVMPRAENAAKEFDGVKNVKNDPEMAIPRWRPRLYVRS